MNRVREVSVPDDRVDWDDLRWVLATARGGSARAAAAALNVSHSTVARRLEAVESRLGAQLFERTADGYRITATGQRLRGAAERMETLWIEAGRLLDGDDPRLAGPVRLTLPHSVAHGLLMPDLAAFAHRYPDIELVVDTSDSLADITRREADVALRFVPVGTTPPPHLVGRHVGVSCNAAYASRTYLAEHRLTGSEADACWVGWDEDVARPAWVGATTLSELPVRHGFADALLQVSAARHGVGIAFVPCALADAEPDLVRVPGTVPLPRFDIWILGHRDLRDTARLRAMRNHLAAAIEAKAGLFLGDST